MLSIGCWADTLQEQINSATDGATITLDADVTISQTILINKNITIDGGSHTITSNVNNKLGTFYINTGTCNFTIQNATIDGGSAASMAVVAYRGTANSGLTTVESGDRDNNNSGNVINMTNCTVKNFTGFPSSYAGAVYVFGMSSANLTNCTFSGNTTSLQSTDGASGADVWAGAAAKVNISGGSYQEVFVNSNKTNNASITISNVAKVEELSVCVTENGSSTNQPSITVDNASVINITTETGNTIPSTAVTTRNGGTVTNIPTEYVAQIGDKKYSSLISAINAATADQTISLLTNVTVSIVDELTINKALTLDLAGHTITSTVKEPIIVKDGGDLTITGNGTIAGPTGDAGKALDGHAIIVVEGGKLTYLNGTLTCGGVGSDGMYGVYVLGNGTAVFGNESDKTGPTITSWFAAIGENNTTAPANITVYGGTYTAQASPSESDWWSYFCAPIYAAGSGEINISGGEFNGYYGLSSRYSNINQDLNISGGTFQGTKSALFIDNKTGVASSESRDVAVSGGTFSSAVPEEYCAEGFVPTPNADGTYGVVEGELVAEVGGKKYASLAAAIAAAEADATVTLLQDVTLTARVEPNKDMTIDLNGHTIKSTATCGNGSAFDVKGGNVVIKNGTIDGTQVTETECDAITARSGANVTLEDLNITVNSKNGACAYAFDGSKITIESGNYENKTTETYQYNSSITGMVVNQANVDTQLIEIKGGTFKGYDPAMGDDSQLANENHTFIAPGFYTEKNADGSYGLVSEYSVTDGIDFKTIAKPVTVATATYSRTMPAGTKWGTVCVPFTLKQGDGMSAPKLYTFGDITESTLTVNEVEEVAPGTPVVFYVEGAEATFTTENAKVNTSDLGEQSGNLVGTYSQQNITEGLSDIYFINGNKFHQAKASLTVPAYRAYIKNASAGAKAAVLSIVVDGEATAIEGVAADLNDTQAIYDVNGRQLSAPQKGINIMKLANGKTVKLIIK